MTKMRKFILILLVIGAGAGQAVPLFDGILTDPEAPVSGARDGAEVAWLFTPSTSGTVHYAELAAFKIEGPGYVRAHIRANNGGTPGSVLSEGHTWVSNNPSHPVIYGFSMEETILSDTANYWFSVHTDENWVGFYYGGWQTPHASRLSQVAEWKVTDPEGAGAFRIYDEVVPEAPVFVLLAVGIGFLVRVKHGRR